MDLIVALTIPGMLCISICFFDTCQHAYNVGDKRLTKSFVFPWNTQAIEVSYTMQIVNEQVIHQSILRNAKHCDLVGFYLTTESFLYQLGSIMGNDNKAFLDCYEFFKILALFPLYECKGMYPKLLSLSVGAKGSRMSYLRQVRKWENRKEVLRCCQSSA